MRSLFHFFALSFAISALCVPAHASPLKYDFAAMGTLHGNISPSLPASRPSASLTATSFEFTSAPLIAGGDSVTKNIDFYALAAGNIAGGREVRVDDPQLVMGFIANSSLFSIPEPSSFLLFGTGLLGFCGVFQKKLRVT
jgi:hypothetical protein